VLFRRTIHFSVGSKHWAEVTYGPADPVVGFLMNKSKIAI